VTPRASFVDAADGTPIAFETRGNGPTFVFTNGLATSSFYWRRLLPRLEDRARLVTWDLKGHGGSGPARALQRTTVADSADDLRRVLDAVGADRAVLFGFSFGCQIVLEAWRHFPDRIAAIVPVLGTYGRPFSTLVSPRVGPLFFGLFRRMPAAVATAALRFAGRSASLPGSFATSQRLGFVGATLTAEDMAPFYEHIGRVHGPTYHAMAIHAQDHTAEDLLPQIRCPVLVVSGGKDAFTPPGAARFMAERIPRAESLHLPEATHTGLLEHPDEIAARLEAFLDAHRLW
jgi:pimeloyl-ACP methyl ester carboxylesterase